MPGENPFLTELKIAANLGLPSVNTGLSANEQHILETLVRRVRTDGPSTNEEFTLAKMLGRRGGRRLGGFDPRRDLYQECGYPQTIEVHDYRAMYDREGAGKRVVNVYPEESWAMDPEVYETEEKKETEFEKAWLGVNEEHACLSMLYSADEMSGIGHFGLLLLGVSDGRELKDPIPGYEGGRPPETPKQLKLIYLRCFDESQVEVNKFETGKSNPRYGQPLTYNVRFMDPLIGRQTGTGNDHTTSEVHWSRVVHVADNRLSSPVYGVPRQQPVFNRLCDLQKILGGSAEMLWQGGFPGLSFETNQDITGAIIDTASVRAEMEKYSAGLQRYLALEGLTAKTLSPNVASPDDHIAWQLKMISITLGVPYRIFLGSEEAKLSSTQDQQTWNKRLARRQSRYITPFLVRPFLKRLIELGVLPKPASIYVHWPDLNTSTDEERAKTAANRATALATYVGSNSEAACRLEDFYVHFLGIKPDVARVIVQGAKEDERLLEPPEPEVPDATAAS